MFFLISKILAPLLEPLTHVVLLLIVACAWHRKPRLSKICLLAALLLLFTFGTSFLPHVLIRILETQYHVPDPVPHVDAVIVLSGAVNLEASSSDYIEFGDGVERILEGIRLIKAGQGDILVLSGGSGDVHDQTRREAPLLREFAIAMGIPEEKILIEPESRNTYENAAYTKTLMDQHSLSTALLVTTATHLPRAMRCFHKVGLHPIAYPVDFQSPPNIEYHLSDMIPSAQALRQTSTILHEYIGIIIYKTVGYI